MLRGAYFPVRPLAQGGGGKRANNRPIASHGALTPIANDGAGADGSADGSAEGRWCLLHHLFQLFSCIKCNQKKSQPTTSSQIKAVAVVGWFRVVKIKAVTVVGWFDVLIARRTTSRSSMYGR